MYETNSNSYYKYFLCFWIYCGDESRVCKKNSSVCKKNFSVYDA